MGKIRMFTLPNIITLMNLLCGCVALFFCFGETNLAVVFWLVVAAAAFDFLDGFTARLTGSYSELGKQLDSLCDMVSFGVVPSGVVFIIFMHSGGWDMGIGWVLLTASVALFSALRLARFNIDETQSKEFRGLPTPACALFVVSAGWMFQRGLFLPHPFVVLGVGLVLSYLLISPVRMFALKFSDYSWRTNKVRYLFVAASAVSLAIWRVASVPFIITAYILISVVLWLACGKRPAGDVPGGPVSPNE